MRRRLSGFIPIAGLLLLLLVSLHLMSDAAQNTSRIGELYTWLLIANSLGLVILLLLIVFQVKRLYRQYRARESSFHLTMRAAGIFLTLALLPVTVVYYFSQQFIDRGIDSWVDNSTVHALESALSLSQASLDLRMREHLRQAEQLMKELDLDPLEGEPRVAVSIDRLRAEFGAQEVTVLETGSSRTGSTEIIAYSHVDPSVLNPHLPDEQLLLQLRHGDHYVGLEPVENEGLFIRVLVRDPRASSALLHAMFPVPEHLNSLAESVQADFARYKELTFLRQPLKETFIQTLRLVLLFTMLAAVWAAFYSARRMTAPIRKLAEGTHAVAEGDYDKQLPVRGNDDLGFLTQSFNDMTRRLSQARDQARRSQRQVEDQREYLETVLGRLSSGVIAIDDSERLRTSNRAAELILQVDLGRYLGYNLADVAQQHPELEHLVNAIQYGAAREQEWREELSLFSARGRQVLLCRGTPFSLASGYTSGYIVVFDDITALIQAQRDSAWGEVARRLAHEFKNPLTPIQLSAERLRHKYLGTMDPGDAAVMDKATHTIVQQVESMKEMVNAFSEYARLPKMEQQPVDLNRLVRDTLELYRDNLANIGINTELEGQLPTIDADAGRLRQVLHNLIKNGLEALAGQPEPKLTVVSRYVEDNGGYFAELSVCDNGPGFPEEILAHAFEPYKTTKPKGTGLGLAIVKKIIEEHAGMIQAMNLPEGGARIVIRLPVASHRQRTGTDS